MKHTGKRGAYGGADAAAKKKADNFIALLNRDPPVFPHELAKLQKSNSTISAASASKIPSRHAAGGKIGIPPRGGGGAEGGGGGSGGGGGADSSDGDDENPAESKDKVGEEEKYANEENQEDVREEWARCGKITANQTHF